MQWKKIKIVVGSFVGIIILLGITGGLVIRHLENEMTQFVNTATFTTPNMQQLQDGEYLGSYKSGVVNVTVEVALRDHRIATIRILKHFNGQGQAAEAIVNDVIAVQRLDVDAIAGATISSKVILKAIERALTPQ